MPGIPLKSIIQFLSGAHVPPEAHVVLVDGVPTGRCTRATVRTVLGLSGLEFPVDYAYEAEGRTTELSGRLRLQGLGQGGREQILVNGENVSGDDVLIGFEADGPTDPAAYVEFRYDAGGEASGDGGMRRSVKFVAPLVGLLG